MGSARQDLAPASAFSSNLTTMRLIDRATGETLAVVEITSCSIPIAVHKLCTT